MRSPFPLREKPSCRWISANKRPLVLVLVTVCVVVLLSHALFVQEQDLEASSVSTRVAFTSHTLAGKDMPEFKPAFPMYQHPGTFVPTWVITSWNTSSVHRFFDSSPFSPSGRYVGVTRLHSEGTDITPKSTADIVVIDLKKGNVCERTVMHALCIIARISHRMRLVAWLMLLRHRKGPRYNPRVRQPSRSARTCQLPFAVPPVRDRRSIHIACFVVLLAN